MKVKKNYEDELADTHVEMSRESVYADLGFVNPNEMETKANLVIELSKSIKKKKITQVHAAALLKITQPKLSQLLAGRFRGYSVERLLHFLNILGQDVDIIVTSKPRNRQARIKVYHSSTDRPASVPMAAKSR
jgi:predicted XRE-type DNA-binding protein